MIQTNLTGRPLISEDEINDLLGGTPVRNELISAAQLSGGRSGTVQSHRPGAGMEFDDLRLYQLGDDPKLIDWRASARSQQTLVRSYLAELQQPLFILVDRGAGMRFGSTQRLKVTQAARLAIKLIGIYHQAGCEVGALLLNPSAQWRPANSNLEALRQLARDAAAPCPPIEPEPHNWPRLFALLHDQLPPGSRLFLLSDFIDLDESAVAQLAALAERHYIQAVRISDPLEQQLSGLEGVQLNWGGSSHCAQTTEQLMELQGKLEQERLTVSERLSRTGVSSSELLSSAETISDSWLREVI